MDPPRQVSRRGFGSGPVFRSFKRVIAPCAKASSSVVVSSAPKSIASPATLSVTTSNLLDPVMRRPKIISEVPIKCISKPGTKISGTTDHHYSETEGMLSAKGLRCSQLKSKVAVKHIANLPQRKHPIQIEVKEEVAVPAKRSGLTRNQRATRVKTKPEDSEKVS